MNREFEKFLENQAIQNGSGNSSQKEEAEYSRKIPSFEELLKYLSNLEAAAQLAPVESLIAEFYHAPGEEILPLIEQNKGMRRSIAMVRNSQKILLCKKLAEEDVSSRCVELLWRILFGEEITAGQNQNGSGLFEEILKLNGERANG
jgi:hypothetical protein